MKRGLAGRCSTPRLRYPSPLVGSPRLPLVSDQDSTERCLERIDQFPGISSAITSPHVDRITGFERIRVATAVVEHIAYPLPVPAYAADTDEYHIFCWSDIQIRHWATIGHFHFASPFGTSSLDNERAGSI